MNGKCPQDGGFLGEAGCTHPNHRHSALVEGLLSANEPREISADDADAALDEGFYVKSGDRLVGFGSRLKSHLEAHGAKDAGERKKRLAFAIDTVRSPEKTENNHKSVPGRTVYLKSFDGFGIVAISDPSGKNLDEVFTVIPKRGLRKRFATRGGQAPTSGTDNK